jgi:hypothetical protein
MHAQINYIIAQEHVADLQRAAERTRLASDAPTGRRRLRHRGPIVRALPMPTAHPSPDAWPAPSRPSGCTDLPAHEILAVADAVVGPG